MKIDSILKALVGVMLISFIGSGAAQAACNWTVRGTVQVRENLTDPMGTTYDQALKGIQVKVSAATVGRVYKSWGTVYTDSNGNFSITKSKNCKNRHIKVQTRFKHSELRIRNPGAGEWTKIYETNSKRGSGTLDLGEKRFTDGSGSTDLNGNDAFRRALAWYVTKTIIDRFQAEDSYFDFKGRVNINYPASVIISSTSYANGIVRTAYVDPTYISDNRRFIETVVHEVMHLWNYDHNSGMTNWLAAVWQDHSTHSFQEDPNVAFHEGFAEFAMDCIFHEIWGWVKNGYWTRAALNSNGLLTPFMVERFDYAVVGALHLLTTKEIYPDSTRFKQCRPSPNINFWEVLSLFEESPSNGYNTQWPVGNSQTGLLDFYDRAADILGHFTEDDKELYVDLLDASGTMDVNDACSPWTYKRSWKNGI